MDLRNMRRFKSLAHFFEEVNGLINKGSISIDGEDIQVD